MDGPRFEDFNFQDQSLHGDNSMIFLEEPDRMPDIFPISESHQPPPQQQQPTPPNAGPQPTREKSASASINTSSTPQGANLSDVDPNRSGPAFAVASEDGNQSQNNRPDGRANPLEDPGGDEFGLGPQTAASGSDSRGKSKEDKSTPAPPWSELKTKAGKERKRLPLACIACRRKKIRCSGEKPACNHCLRSRVPCVYKVTTRKAAPRTDYMAMLDKRLKRMEERIIKIVPLRDRDASVASVARAVVKPPIPGTNTAPKSSVKKRPVDEAFGHDLENWARRQSIAEADPANKPTSLLIQEAEENKLFREGMDALPSKEIQEHLAEVFFANIYGQAYHLLHKPSYMRKLQAGTLPPVLILSVCAVSARFSTHPQLNTTPNFLRGEEWAATARQICTTRYEWPNITILTCLLILGLHEFGTCHGGRSWALGGQAIRMAFALQLHKDLERDPLNHKNGTSQLSFIDREIRRRVMWSCFIMDRFNSSGTDRPIFVREETIKIPLPVKEKYFQLDMPVHTETLAGDAPDLSDPDEAHLVADPKANLGVAAYMIRSIALWGRIISYLNQGGIDLDPHPIWSPDSGYAKLIKDADELTASLPETLRYTHDNLHLYHTEGMANQFLFLHISMQQNILFLNRVAVATPGGPAAKDVPQTFVANAGAETFSAANRISDILKDAEAHMVSAPFVGYCAFSSATIHVIGIFSGNPTVEAAAKRNLTINVKYLSKMKRYWGMFHFMSESLREQYRSCADAARQGGQTTKSATASPIFQYGDWFDRYPHGVSQTGFGDTVTVKHKEKGVDAVLEQKPELHTVEELFTSLSPPQSTGSNKDAAQQGPPKKKQVVYRTAPGAGDQQQPPQTQLQPQSHDPGQHEPLLPDFNGVSMDGTRSNLGSTPSSHANSVPGQLGAQAGGFNPLMMSQSQGNSYHAMSPVSPIGVNQFGTPGHPHQRTMSNSFYSPDLLSMSLNQQANSMLQPLDRQLVFGGYSTEPGSLARQQQALINAVANWDNLSANSQDAARLLAQRSGSMGGRVANRPGGMRGAAAAAAAAQQQQQPQPQPQQQQQMQHQGHLSAFLGSNSNVGGSGGGGGGSVHEASSAWFMPFNLEPPEIGLDFGGISLDGLVLNPNSPNPGNGPGGPFSAGGQ